MRWRKRLRFGAVDQLVTQLNAQAKPVRAGMPPRDVPGLGFEQNGVELEAFVETVGKYDYIVVRAPTPSLPPVYFRKENGRDRAGKLLRLNRELQTGDDEFDRAIYIESDAPE